MHPKINMMKQLTIQLNLIIGTAMLFLTQAAVAQAVPTASQALQLSAFGGLTGVFTDIEGGHNLSISAGVDLAFLSLRGFHLAAEGRGTYPMDTGTISSQKGCSRWHEGGLGGNEPCPPLRGLPGGAEARSTT